MKVVQRPALIAARLENRLAVDVAVCGAPSLDLLGESRYAGKAPV